MATVVVEAHNNRIEDAETVTGWTNISGGGGIAVETDIVYQASGAASRKVSTSFIGRGFLDGSTWDFTAARRDHWIAKINVTNYSALQARSTPTLALRIGNSATVYYDFYPYGTPGSADGYPITGGWQFVAIDPSVASYRAATGGGGPTLTAIDYFGIVADLSAGSKAENVVIDAIDCGVGLHMTAGDGASADGTYDDFVSYDEGTASKRFGYVSTRGGIIYVLGGLFIGQSGDEVVSSTSNVAPVSAVTEFTDSGQTLVWQNGYMSTGFNRHVVDLATSGTVIDLDGITYISTGAKDNTWDGREPTSPTEDTRTEWETIGTTGTLTMDGCRLVNFSDVILTSAATLTGCDIQTETLTQGSADIEGDSIIRTTSVGDAATITNPTFGTATGINNTEFIQEGAGHAVQITGTTQTITLTNVTWTGYGANDTSSSAIEFTGTGPHTVNWSGGTAPTIQDNGQTVSVVNSVAVAVTCLDADDLTAISGARVIVTAASGGDLPFEDTVTIATSGTTATVTHTGHGLVSNDKVVIKGANEEELLGINQITVTGANTYTYTITSIGGDPGTGTITSTAVIIDEDTNISGVADNAAFPFTNNQPISGRARKSSASPYYKTSAITGTIDSTGFSTTIVMISDE
ncbi:MAG: hypothetical protein KJN71_09520 [Acidimicrobiia bacterium]|nr:hypothetical protein [Acidimicrobiia bacterium]